MSSYEGWGMQIKNTRKGCNSNSWMEMNAAIWVLKTSKCHIFLKPVRLSKVGMDAVYST